MNRIHLSITILILTLSYIRSDCQVSINWSMSKDTIELGDTATLKIVFKYDPETKVYTFPNLPNELDEDIVVLDSTDWIKYKESPLVEWIKTYTLLHLKSQLLELEPLRTAYLYNAQYDTARSKPIIYEVLPPDEPDGGLEDIKDIERTPQEGTPWTWIIGILLFALSFIYLIWYLKQKVRTPIMPDTDYHIFVPKFEEIKSKLQQINSELSEDKISEKESIIELTATLKDYLSYINQMPLLPETTSATLKILRQRLNGDSYLAMEQMLYTADLVKFAKYSISRYDIQQMIETSDYLINTWYTLYDPQYTQSNPKETEKGGDS
jgi:hypothetical protein